jgi:hypothetical protein
MSESIGLSSCTVIVVVDGRDRPIKVLNVRRDKAEQFRQKWEDQRMRNPRQRIKLKSVDFEHEEWFVVGQVTSIEIEPPR